MKIAFFGSSLVSSYWNGAATYYRGIVRALHGLGHRVTFYEPDAYDRPKHRDIPDPEWAEVVVFPSTLEAAERCMDHAAGADLVVKANGVGVFDAELERGVLARRRPGQAIVFWDVDAPATLDRMEANPEDSLRNRIPEFDAVLTYGGGDPVVAAYRRFGARLCLPIYNAVDPDVHYPVPPDDGYRCDLALLANRLPDREARIDTFFFEPAVDCPEAAFLLAGNGWHDKPKPASVREIGHLGTADHNAFNASARLVLNVSRESMARYGFSPATRVFEAAAAGACLVTDAWEGLEQFLAPDREVLVAEGGEDVARYVHEVDSERARQVGERALHRVLSEHTYAHRARELERALDLAAVGGRR